MMWGASEGMGWWMVFGSIFWIVVVVLLVGLFVRVFQQSENTKMSPPEKPEDPIDIVRRRYASGELSDEDYRRLLDNLQKR